MPKTFKVRLDPGLNVFKRNIEQSRTTRQLDNHYETHCFRLYVKNDGLLLQSSMLHSKQGQSNRAPLYYLTLLSHVIASELILCPRLDPTEQVTLLRQRCPTSASLEHPCPSVRSTTFGCPRKVGRNPIIWAAPVVQGQQWHIQHRRTMWAIPVISWPIKLYIFISQNDIDSWW